MRPVLCTLGLLLFLSGEQLSADVTSAAPDRVAVTIYRDLESGIYDDLYGSEYEEEEYDISTGLAMVTETRTIQVPAGISTIVFRGVADAIVPQTATIDGLPALVLETNFDYDLLSPGALISKSLGKRVRLVRTDDATGRVTEQHATLISGPQGVMLEIDGQVESLDCSLASEKLIFDSIPESLTSQPTLSMKVRAQEAGEHVVQLSYLALGLDWSADYVAHINPDGRSLRLTGWITLVNRAATTFANAPTDVVAGELSRTPEETQPPGANEYIHTPLCWPYGSFKSRLAAAIAAQDIGRFPDAAPYALQRVGDFEEVVVTGLRQSVEAKLSELGDYKLYTLPEPTTVAARQSKQVRFLSLENVKFERLYTYRLDPENYDEIEAARALPVTTLRLKNEQRQGLGRPLPAGTISVLEPSASSPHKILAGEKFLQDTPIGLPFDIELGGALDVWVEPTITEDETFDAGDTYEEQAKVEVRFGNDKPVPVVIEYRQAAAEGLRIVRESKRHTMKDGDPMWTIRLAPGARAALRYTLRSTE